MEPHCKSKPAVLRTSLDEKPRHVQMAFLQNSMQRRLTTFGLLVDVRALVDQQTRHVQMTVYESMITVCESSKMQRRVTTFGLLVDVRALVDQQTRHVLMAFRRSMMQRRLTTFGLLVDVRARVDQQPRQDQMTVLRSMMQGHRSWSGNLFRLSATGVPLWHADAAPRARGHLRRGAGLDLNTFTQRRGGAGRRRFAVEQWGGAPPVFQGFSDAGRRRYRVSLWACA